MLMFTYFHWVSVRSLTPAFCAAFILTVIVSMTVMSFEGTNWRAQLLAG